MKVKGSEKVGLKLNVEKTKIMASGPITSWQIDGETVESVADFILGGSKITANGDHPMDCSTPGLPVHHQLPELAHTHIHRVSNAIQTSHHLSSPSPPTFDLSQHQDLFPMSQFIASGGQSTRDSASASVLPVNIQD